MSVIDPSGRKPERSHVLAALFAPVTQLIALSAETKIILIIGVAVCIWGLAVLVFGLPALVVPMNVIVPAVFVLLVLLTWDR